MWTARPRLQLKPVDEIVDSLVIAETIGRTVPPAGHSMDDFSTRPGAPSPVSDTLTPERAWTAKVVRVPKLEIALKTAGGSEPGRHASQS